MSSLPNLVNVPCKIGGGQVLTNIANGAGKQSAYSNLVPVLVALGPVQTLQQNIYNAMVGNTARPTPSFGATGSDAVPVGPQRWPLKL
jgi:hypothetical protein